MHTRGSRGSSHAAVLVAYVVLAIVFSWPLPLNMSTHLTGVPGGDTGVYVWNQWVFRHEILQEGHFPYFTDRIFSLTEPTNLSLHNYTTFQNLLALPLIGILGVVTTFNVIYLLMTVLTAYTTFLLAKHVTGHVAESWLAGALFAWSPLLVTRGTEHFSLVAAAPLAIFLLVLLKADGHERFRDAVALGATEWLAASTDVYYAVYCLLIGAIFLAARVVAIHRSPQAGRSVAVRWALDVLILSIGGFIAALVVSGGWQISIMGWPLPIHSLYTPMMLLTILVAIRVAWELRTSLLPTSGLWQFIRFSLVAGVVAIFLLSPVLYATAIRIRTSGQLDPSKIFWRSSPAGVDLLAIFLPNPNHPFAPVALVDWLNSLPTKYIEGLVSVPLVAIVTLCVAWRAGWIPSRWWTGLTVLFGLLALGPFIHIAGVNTYVPGPWAFLRYVPIVGLTRSPSRFSVVLMLGIAILFATALVALTRRYPATRRVIVTTVGALLLFELLPAPRPIYSAAIPRLYQHVKDAPRDLRLLELPVGARDGTSNIGNFTARSQFYQTFHEKALVGGYLSRVSRRRINLMRSNEMVDALLILSEGGDIPEKTKARLIDLGPTWSERSNIGFVVIDRPRTSEALRAFAIGALRLEQVDSEGDLELYRPRIK
jgi:hypothetical protein